MVSFSASLIPDLGVEHEASADCNGGAGSRADRCGLLEPACSASETRALLRYRAEVAAAQIRGHVEQGSLPRREPRAVYAERRSGAGDAGEEFESNASRWLSPAGFPAAAWVEQVPAAQRAAYERRTGHPIVTVDRQLAIVPVGPRSWYCRQLSSRRLSMDLPGIDLSGETGMAAAAARARALYAVSATPLGNPARWRGAPSRPARSRPRGAPAYRRSSWCSCRNPRCARRPRTRRRCSSPSAAPPLEISGARRPCAARSWRRDSDSTWPCRWKRSPAPRLPWVILAVGLVLAGLAGALGVTRRGAPGRRRARPHLQSFFRPDCGGGFRGTFHACNPAVEQILGYTAGGSWRGLTFNLSIRPPRRPVRRRPESSKGRRSRRSRTATSERMAPYRVLEWTSTPVLHERLMYGVARDVTERQQAESELRRLAGEQAARRRVATLRREGCVAD